MVEPLSPEERKDLVQTRGRLIGLGIAALCVLPVAFLAPVVFPMSQESVRALQGTVIAGLLITGVLKLSERCPRCGAIPGIGPRGTLPDRCNRCGVAFGEP